MWKIHPNARNITPNDVFNFEFLVSFGQEVPDKKK